MFWNTNNGWIRILFVLWDVTQIQNTSDRVWNLVLLFWELVSEFKLGNLLAIFVDFVILAFSRGFFTGPMFSSFKLDFSFIRAEFCNLSVNDSLADRFILWAPNPKPLKISNIIQKWQKGGLALP